MVKEIKILHSSCCAKGSPIKEQIEKIASNKNVQVRIEELSDLQDTMPFGALSFPSVVIDGKVYNYRKFRTEEELAFIL